MTEAPPATATKSGAPDPLLGRVIAERFKITSLIARGGMGKVYRAEQAPLGRLCAVKVLNPNYNGDADPEFHRRFYREASIASKITHPNSVTIFDYGRTDDDVYYMAMEYLEGQTLHHALREQKTMAEERVGRIAGQICRALREAHSLGVIHRDLKPANIFLTRHGDDEDFVKILDFGLVKHIAERPEEQLTQTGLFMGSPKYMAPEQIQGGVVDERTDIYSLGIILYEMLAGKVPFERTTSVNILMAHVSEPPPPMRAVRPDLVCSPAFEEIVMSCIAKNPKERFASMDELLSAIKRAHGGSMTGQLTAITSSFPPSGRHSVPAHVAASGAHTPMGVQRSDGATETPGALTLAEPKRARTWLAIGVLGAAAAIGCIIGLVAFRMTVGAEVGSKGPVAAAPPASVALPPAIEDPARPEDSPTREPRDVTVRLVTDPPGAAVLEEEAVLCAATPCELTFPESQSDAGGTHKLTFHKSDYRTESRVVSGAESVVTVKLSPRPTAPPRRIPAPPSPKPADTTPSGFKDLPY